MHFVMACKHKTTGSYIPPAYIAAIRSGLSVSPEPSERSRVKVETSTFLDDRKGASTNRANLLELVRCDAANQWKVLGCLDSRCIAILISA